MGYADLRDWIGKLEAEGELCRVTAEVDWDGELAAICRKVLTARGPALLFENIKDYKNTRCTKLFTGGLGNAQRVALMFGLPKDTPRRKQVELFRQAMKHPIPPVVVQGGPVKENIVTGDAIDLTEFPVPKWHSHDGGRYINTWCGVVTRDPDTGHHNVGMYRGMLVGKREISVLLLTAQHWGQHLVKYAARGEPMPVSVVYGWDPSLGFTAASQIHPQLCEYDVMGAIRQQPVKLVKSETSDVLVPASAEIVVEGFISPKAEKQALEGPFGEYTGYYGGERRKRYVIEVASVAHRNDPIYRGNLEGASAAMPNEDSFVYAVSTRALMLEVLEAAGVPGVLDVRPGPVNLVKIKQTYLGQAKQVAAALWGSWAAEYMLKVIMVVDEDIDIYNDRAVQWALCYRVNPGPEDLLIMPETRGGALDPSTPDSERNDMLLGTGRWNRLLIDATRDLRTAQRDEFGQPKWLPLSIEVDPKDRELVERRWAEYGIPLPQPEAR